MYADMARDPPDPAYGTVTPPQPLDISPITPASLDGATRSVDLERADMEAGLHAFERYQGARNAGATNAEIAQLRAAGDDVTALANELAASAQKLRAWATDAANDPTLSGVVLSSTDAPTIRALYQRVQQSDLPPTSSRSSTHTAIQTRTSTRFVRTRPWI